MPVRKRGDIWYARIQIGGRRTERPAGPRRADAIALEARLRNQSQQAPGTGHSLDAALLRWLEGEGKSLRDYGGNLNKIRQMRAYTEAQPISAAREVAGRIIKDGLAAGLKPATINRRLAIIRRVVRLTHEWGWTPAPPLIKLLPGEQARTLQLTQAQVDALALAADGPVRDAIILAAYTGLREGELLALQAANVVEGILTLTASKTGRQRAIPLPQRAMQIVPRLPLPLTYAQLRVGFEAARERATMPEVQFRDLRRTYGSWIVQRTGNLKAAQDLLGHSTPVITARHYAHLLPSHLADAVATLDDAPHNRKLKNKLKKA